MDILIATKNEHKIEEIKRMLLPYANSHSINLKSLLDFEEVKDAIENGATFIDNAKIKAKYYYDCFKIPVISDDSGLCVEALGGLPGIYSARYASKDAHNASSYDNRKKLLKDLENIDNRKASFICAMVYFDGSNYTTSIGKTDGEILHEETGNNGFGYDCIFFSDDLNMPLGIAKDDEKDSISHRGRALKKLISMIFA